MTTLPVPRFTDPFDAPVLRWGVLAPGGIARDFVSALQQHTSQKVVAAGSRSLERAESFVREFGLDRAYGSYQELVEDPEIDVVYVSSTHNAHEELALAAIAAGKNVLVEKPAASTAAAAQRIADAARAAGVFVMEAMWTRYLPHVDVARQLLENGELGEVGLVAADFGFPAAFDPESRMFDPAKAGGALLDLGVYPISFAQFALPALAEGPAVHAFGTLAVTGVDAQTSMILETGAGAQALLSVSITAALPAAAWIGGSRGRIDVHAPFWSPSGLTFTPVQGEPATFIDPSGIRGRDGFAYEGTAVARYISDGLLDSPLHPFSEAIATLRIIDEARRQLGYRADWDE
jgi:predicted dehydrogenase